MKDNIQTFAIIASNLWMLVPRSGFLQNICEDIITDISKNARTHSAKFLSDW